jgi:hypothetical protein
MALPTSGGVRAKGEHMRMRIVLSAAAVLAAGASVAVAVPALADGAGSTARQEKAPAVVVPEVGGRSEVTAGDQGKWPGDPYAGKCVFALRGDSEVRPCQTGR